MLDEWSHSSIDGSPVEVVGVMAPSADNELVAADSASCASVMIGMFLPILLDGGCITFRCLTAEKGTIVIIEPRTECQLAVRLSRGLPCMYLIKQPPGPCQCQMGRIPRKIN